MGGEADVRVRLVAHHAHDLHVVEPRGGAVQLGCQQLLELDVHAVLEDGPTSWAMEEIFRTYACKHTTRVWYSIGLQIDKNLLHDEPDSKNT